jgi:hypothetical protein
LTAAAQALAAALLLATPAAAAPLLEIHDPFDAGFSVCREAFIADCSFSFGLVDVGTSRRFTFVLRNPGDAVLTISALTIQGVDEFTLEAPRPTSVEAGADAFVTVVYAPRVDGDPAALVTIESDAANVDPAEDVVITIIGSGNAPIGPIAAVSPAACAFGDVVVGDDAGCAVSLRNDGDRDLVLEASSFSGDAVFVVDGVLTLPTRLTAGAVLPVTLSAAPVAPGAVAGTFLVESNGGALSVALTANGVAGAGEGEGEGDVGEGEGDVGEGEGDVGEGEGDVGEGEGEGEGDVGEGEGEDGTGAVDGGCACASSSLASSLSGLGLLLLRRRRR